MFALSTSSAFAYCGQVGILLLSRGDSADLEPVDAATHLRAWRPACLARLRADGTLGGRGPARTPPRRARPAPLGGLFVQRLVVHGSLLEPMECDRGDGWRSRRRERRLLRGVLGAQLGHQLVEVPDVRRRLHAVCGPV